ncbi:MAG: tandem-95 repeat protein [Pirellulales bacterium]
MTVTTPLTLTAADLKGNDTDVDNTNSQLTVTAVSSASHGTVVLNPDGTVTFTPDANYHGPAGFDYTVSDGSLTDTGHVSINVTPVNDLPQAVNDSYTIDEDGVLSVPAPGVLANDIDIDGDPITAVGYFNASHGVVSAFTNGSFGYTPQANYNGADSFIYKIWDGHGDYTNDHSPSTYATVNITVRSVNDSPSTLTLSNAAIEENAGADVVIGSFSSVDPDAGDTFTYTLATGAGDTDNSLFQIVGDQLRVIDSLDFEASPIRTVRARTTDVGGLWYEQSFVINVIDLPDTGILLKGSSGDDRFTVVYSSDEFTIDWIASGGPVTHFGPYTFGTSLEIDGLSGFDQLNLVLTPDQLADLTTSDIGTLKGYLASPNGGTLSLMVPTSSPFESTGFEAVDLSAHDDGQATSIATCFANITGESQIQAGGIGPDTLTGTNATDLIFGGDGNDLIYGLDGADCIFGGAGDDALFGNNMNDRLEGGTGVDTLLGELGYDLLRGGPGNDSLDGGMHDDQLDGGPGVDSIQGGPGYDVILVRFDEAAYDSIHGGDNTDIFVNDAAAPVVMAGFDASVGSMEGWNGNGQPILGTENNDVFSFQITISYSLSLSGVPYIDGRGGNDILYGTQGTDVLRGGDGNDTLFGFGGVDTLYGDAGDDSLNGGAAIDYLYGGNGADSLTGGDGRDVLYFSDDLTSVDTITDFQIYSDTINLQAYATSYAQLIFTIVSPDTTIQLNNGKKIRLTNWTRKVGSTQFIF